MRKLMATFVLLALAGSLGACACRPGVIGPYGGHPPRCWIW